MFEGVTIAQSVDNPLRDTITDDESGLSMEVINMSREMFTPTTHMEPYEFGFFVSFTNNPLHKYSGIYFILGSVSEGFNINMQDIITVAHYYCNLRQLPQPQGITPVNNMHWL